MARKRERARSEAKWAFPRIASRSHLARIEREISMQRRRQKSVKGQDVLLGAALSGHQTWGLTSTCLASDSRISCALLRLSAQHLSVTGGSRPRRRQSQIRLLTSRHQSPLQVIAWLGPYLQMDQDLGQHGQRHGEAEVAAGTLVHAREPKDGEGAWRALC